MYNGWEPHQVMTRYRVALIALCVLFGSVKLAQVFGW